MARKSWKICEELLRFPDFLFWRRHGHSLQNLVETSRWNTGTDCKNVKVTSPHSFKPRGPFIANPVERRPKSSGGCWNFLASHSSKTRKPTCIFCIQKHNIRYPLQSILARGSYLRSQRTGPIILIYSNMGNCSQCLSRGKEVWLTSLIGLAVSKRQVILFSAIMYANFHFWILRWFTVSLSYFWIPFWFSLDQPNSCLVVHVHIDISLRQVVLCCS